MSATPPSSELRLERAQSIREAVALAILAFFTVSLLAAAVVSGARGGSVGAGVAATLASVGAAAYAVGALRGPTPGAAFAAVVSLSACGVAGGLFVSEIGGITSVGLAILIASWAPAAWLAPRRQLVLWLGLLLEIATFATVATGGAARPSIPLPQLALMAAGVVMLTNARIDLARRTVEDATAWQKLENAQAELELRRSELERKSSDLNRAAGEQLDELLSHAKTTGELERLLAARVAGRSRQLADNVARPLPARVTLSAGAPCGKHVVLGRMSPAPYADCYLTAEPPARARHFVTALFASREVADVTAQLASALVRGGSPHPAIAAAVEIAVLQDHVLVVSEHRPGRLLSHVIARPDLGWGESAQLARSIAVALAAWHATSGCHLGLDPYRIVVGNLRHGVSIYGAGLAQAWQAAGGDAETLAQIASRPAYRAPECSAVGLGGAPADVYSLGVLLFEMAANLHPVAARVHESGKNAARALLSIRPAIDPRLAELVQAMLSENPAERPAMATVASELGRITSAHGVAEERAICARLNGSSALMAVRPEGAR